jgi:hypothetical protein
MKETVNVKFRLFRRRGGVYYYENRDTRKQLSLGTKDKTEAVRLLHAQNEAQQNPVLNLQIARAYLAASDPAIAKRTWRYAAEELVKTKQGNNAIRWSRAIKDSALDGIQDLPLIETRPDQLLEALNKGTVSTNVFLRRIHNFAVAMSWLPCGRL